jgi:hypothetical protein
MIHAPARTLLLEPLYAFHSNVQQTVNSTMFQSFVMHFHLVSLNNETATGERWQVHKLNCRDVKKLVKRGDRAHIVTAESPEALVKAELADELSEMGWSAEDFRIIPCCKG